MRGERRRAYRRASYAASKAVTRVSVAAVSNPYDAIGGGSADYLTEAKEAVAEACAAVERVWPSAHPSRTYFGELPAAEEAVVAAGRAIDAEISIRARERINEIKSRYAAAGVELDPQARETAASEQASKLIRQYQALPREDTAAREEAWGAYRRAAAQVLELRRGDDPLSREIAAARVDVTVAVLSELRALGPGSGGHPFHGHSSKREAKVLAAAQQVFPREWVADSAAAVDFPLRVRATKARAHYQHSHVVQWSQSERGPVRRSTFAEPPAGARDLETDTAGGFTQTTYTIDVDYKVQRLDQVSSLLVDTGTSPVGQPGQSTAAHEFTHRCEATRPRLGVMQRQFLRRRCTDPETGGLSGTARLYPDAAEGSKRSREVARTPLMPFVTPYVGKDYGRETHFEVLSVGAEAVFSGAYGGLVGEHGHTPDWDHRAFVLGAWATL